MRNFIQGVILTLLVVSIGLNVYMFKNPPETEYNNQQRAMMQQLAENLQ